MMPIMRTERVIVEIFSAQASVAHHCRSALSGGEQAHRVLALELDQLGINVAPCLLSRR
jgi:hypothetical protein